jgi:MYXO-CTERM domain-containing protein
MACSAAQRPTTMTCCRAPPPVPEADTWAMLLAGLGLVGWQARRRKAAASAG